MKPTEILKKVFVTASVTFTVFVYLLYFFAFRITADSLSEALSLRMLTGFFLFGALLGLTGVFTDSLKLSALIKRLIHFGLTLANFILTLLLISGYAEMGQSQHASLNTATRVAVMLIIFVAVYWICVGDSALVKKLFGNKKSKSDYKPVYKK